MRALLFYAAGNVDHDMAEIPMCDFRKAILDFMARFVKGKKPLALDTGETCADRAESEKRLYDAGLSHGLFRICAGPEAEY